MELKYFSLSDDRDTLKKKYKQLAIANHPDKNIDNQEECTAIMQDINSELDYCLRKLRGENDESQIMDDLVIFMREVLQSINARSGKESLFKFMLLGMTAMGDLSLRNPKVSTYESLLEETMVSMRNALKKRKESDLNNKAKVYEKKG